MARGGQQRGNHHQHASAEDSSSANAGDADAQPDVQVWVDELSEKAKATRAHGIKMLTDYLRRNAESDSSEGQDPLAGTLVTLVSSLRTILRKSPVAEFESCCTLVEVLAIVLTPESKRELFAECYEPLLTFMKDVDRCGAAIRALALLASLCNEEDDVFFSTLDQSNGLLTAFLADEPKIAALQTWGYLASLADASYLVKHRGSLRHALQSLLTHGNTEVRAEAGEDLALLLSVCANADDVEDVDSEDEDEDNSAAEKHVHNANDAAPSFDEQPEHKTVEQGLEIEDSSKFVTGDEVDDENLDNLVEVLEDLSHQNEKNVTKRDLREQRARFRSILASVRDETEPEMKMSLDKVNVTLEGWLELKRADFLREVLGERLASHAKVNEAIQNLLNLRAKLDETYFADDGHLVGMDGAVFSSSRSAKTKERSQMRSKARNQREAVKDDFLQA